MRKLSSEKKIKKFLNRNCVIGKKNDKIVKEIFQTSTFNTQDHDSIYYFLWYSYVGSRYIDYLVVVPHL